MAPVYAEKWITFVHTYPALFMYCNLLPGSCYVYLLIIIKVIYAATITVYQ